MSEALSTILIIFGGLSIGVFLRKVYPNKCKAYAKFSLNGQWKLFLFGVLFFLALSVMSFVLGDTSQGILLLLFVALELFALARYGFKQLTPAQEARIDASDPTKLWPISLW